MFTHNRLRWIPPVLIVAGLGFGIVEFYKSRNATLRMEPLHTEADNLRYLDPSQFKAVGCGADGVTWTPRADGVCYAADKPAVVSGEQMLEAWGTAATPAAQDESKPCIAAQPDRYGNAYLAPCADDDDPYAMQGQWMADAAIHDANCAEGNSEPSDLCCLNEVDEPSPCDIAHGTFSSAPPAGPTYGQWLTPDQMRAVPPAIPGPCSVIPDAKGGGFICDLNNPNANYLYVPPTDNNSEELEQDNDYSNEINEGRQI